jgi:uncharacterized protein
VNVLVALLDPAHVHHDRAHEWFAAEGGANGFATCPVTEKSVLRIIGNARYLNSPGTPAAVVGLLAGLGPCPVMFFGPTTSVSYNLRSLT